MNMKVVLFIKYTMKKLAIIGASGLVGQTVLKVLKEENLMDKFVICLIVSNKSAGLVLEFDNKHYNLIELNKEVLKQKFDYAIFSAGEDISKKWAKKFTSAGTVVIDNSSAFRLNKGIPLVVPEINFEQIKNNKLIANPNCSTIQLVVVLDKLKNLCEIEKVIVSSYQSVSGAGKEALKDLAEDGNEVFKVGIKDNLIARIGDIEKNGNCVEENKIINETKKILCSNFDVFATTVRIPISFCHGESVYVKFKEDVDLGRLKKKLECDYIKISNDLCYPKFVAESDLTYVCRLRKFSKDEIGLFILADNLRRGAAYNAVGILKKITKNEN